jgi:DNA ligase-1
MVYIDSSSVLQSKTSKGLAKYWRGYICEEDGHYFLQTSYWQHLKDGSPSTIQYSVPYEIYPKNVGRSNETSAEAQAKLEFAAMVKKQQDKGYCEEGKEAVTLPLPMLAQKFTERKHTITYPVYVQPKYNGMRMLFNGEKGWSRGGKEIDDKVIKHLKFDTCGYVVDGELILPGNVLLQESMKAAKKYRAGISDKLLYVIYDVIIPNFPYSARKITLYNIFVNGIAADNVQMAPTHLAMSEEDVYKYHKQFVDEGFEGIIVRSGTSGYKVGHRDNQLMKYKTFLDAEWPIIDVREGEGSFKGCAIFICDASNGKTFECNPKGTMEYKQELWNDRENLKGQLLTIQYAELSQDGIPLFPVGLTVREIG